MLLLLTGAASATDYGAFRAALAEPAGWESVGSKKVDAVDVAIAHKVIQGQACLQGTTVAPLEGVHLLRAAADIPAQPSWSRWDVVESVQLSQGASGFDYYQVLDNPYPVNDRFWFLRARVVESGGVRSFAWEALDASAYPEARRKVAAAYPNAIETLVNVGDWTFTPTESGTHIRYRICTDVGGNIPSWAGEYAARTTLPGNLADLVAEVQRRVGR